MNGVRAMSIHEIVLPETKPETEWVRGRALQKVSPVYKHALLQRRLAGALGSWAEDGAHGRVGTEWRFRVAPPGEVVRPLVPDVAYLSYEALSETATEDEVAVPRLAPTVAVEVLSPDDRSADVEHKIATYLAAGSAAVIVVDPELNSVTIRHAGDARLLAPGDTLTHAALPGFALDVQMLFARMN